VSASTQATTVVKQTEAADEVSTATDLISEIASETKAGRRHMIEN
jgi:hypothetical protein